MAARISLASSGAVALTARDSVVADALNPGLVATEGGAAAGNNEGSFAEAAIKATPLGRIGLPDDIGPVAAFLASDDAHWVTGQRLIVGGGATL